MKNAITDITGIKVGHAQDMHAITGCTVVLCEEGAVAGVDQRGGGPGTRETDLLNPVNNVQEVHAIMLAGGSAFGLDAAGGAMRFIKENNKGYNTGIARIPIVPAAILFDLVIGDNNAFPDSQMGYQACLNASSDAPAQGNIGAGIGCTAGKILGINQATKTGIGTASVEISKGVLVAALIAVNPVGDVLDPNTNEIIAGTRPLQKGPVRLSGNGKFANSLELLRGAVGRGVFGLMDRTNTVIGVVATNAKLTKPEATKVAQMAQAGVARCIRPAHTMHDGDTLFAIATGKKKANVNIVGAYAAEITVQAILNAVHSAQSLGGVPAASDL